MLARKKLDSGTPGISTGAWKLSVDGVAHDQMAEGGLAGAVGAHQDMGLSGGDIEVHVMEDGLLIHGGGEALDVEQRVFAHGFPLFCSGFTAAKAHNRKP